MTAEPTLPGRRQVAYRLPSTTLAVPTTAWDLTMAVFAPYAEGGLEACCFWYGIRDDCRNGRVAGVVVPGQRNTWGSYRVDGAAMTAVARVTAVRGWRNLAQLHTHPCAAVEHSPYDDANANSRRALSLVLPHHGREWSWPSAVGVHEFQDGAWHRLADPQAAARIRLLDRGDVEIVDLR